MRTMPMLILAISTLFATPLPAAMAQSNVPATPPAATPAPAPAPVPAPATPDKVTGAAAWERLKGNTIEGKLGGQTFAEFFDPAGGVRYVDQDGPSAGTWTVKGAKVCFDFPEDDDRNCSTFEVTGSTGTSTEDDGTVVAFDITPGNGKGL